MYATLFSLREGKRILQKNWSRFYYPLDTIVIDTFFNCRLHTTVIDTIDTLIQFGYNDWN